eukprot:m.345423 g.345423  ORF g.345423 m.345423 type:complete len:751 (-) comp26333_c0_seq1:187-2439(-)
MVCKEKEGLRLYGLKQYFGGLDYKMFKPVGTHNGHELYFNGNFYLFNMYKNYNKGKALFGFTNDKPPPGCCACLASFEVLPTKNSSRMFKEGCYTVKVAFERISADISEKIRDDCEVTFAWEPIKEVVYEQVLHTQLFPNNKFVPDFDLESTLKKTQANYNKPGRTLIFKDDTFHEESWGRLAELSAPYDMTILEFPDSMKKRHDTVAQGELGNCYLVAIVGSLYMQSPHILKRVFQQCQVNEFGIYALNLYNPTTGNFEYIILDDTIPTNKGRPMYAHSNNNRDEVGVSLIEKALAKIANGYHNLEGSKDVFGSRDVIHYICGPTQSFEQFDIRKEIKIDVEDKIKTALQNNYVLYIGVNSKTKDTLPAKSGILSKSSSQAGLVTKHAYSIIGYVEVKGNVLVQLRNPWTRRGVKGVYSNTCKRWVDDQAHVENTALGCGVFTDFIGDKDAGTFWVKLDLLRRFDECHITLMRACSFAFGLKHAVDRERSWRDAVEHCNCTTESYELALNKYEKEAKQLNAMYERADEKRKKELAEMKLLLPSNNNINNESDEVKQQPKQRKVTSKAKRAVSTSKKAKTSKENKKKDEQHKEKKTVLQKKKDELPKKIEEYEDDFVTDDEDLVDDTLDYSSEVEDVRDECPIVEEIIRDESGLEEIEVIIEGYEMVFESDSDDDDDDKEKDDKADDVVVEEVEEVINNWDEFNDSSRSVFALTRQPLQVLASKEQQPGPKRKPKYRGKEYRQLTPIIEV